MFLSGKVNVSSIHYLDTITSHKILKCFITYDRKRKKVFHYKSLYADLWCVMSGAGNSGT